MPGYRLVGLSVVPAEEVVGPLAASPGDLVGQGAQECVFAVFENGPKEGGPTANNRFSMLYVGGEAVAGLRALFAARQVAPKAFVFGGKMGDVASNAISEFNRESGLSLPEWLVSRSDAMLGVMPRPFPRDRYEFRSRDFAGESMYPEDREIFQLAGLGS